MEEITSYHDVQQSGMDRMSTVIRHLLGGSDDEPQRKESGRKRKRQAVEEEGLANSSSDEDEKIKGTGNDVVDHCHIIPDPVLWEYEKRLKKLATKGVVQLFNAVNKQQKDLEKKLKSVGSSEIKRDKVIQSVDKSTFLGMLRGKQQEDNTRHEVPDNQPSWSILRDDYKLDDAMKEWD